MALGTAGMREAWGAATAGSPVRVRITDAGGGNGGMMYHTQPSPGRGAATEAAMEAAVGSAAAGRRPGLTSGPPPPDTQSALLRTMGAMQQEPMGITAAGVAGGAGGGTAARTQQLLGTLGARSLGATMHGPVGIIPGGFNGTLYDVFDHFGERCEGKRASAVGHGGALCWSHGAWAWRDPPRWVFSFFFV